MWLGREENQVPLVYSGSGGKPVVIDRLSERVALCHLGVLESILQALVLVHTLPAGTWLKARVDVETPTRRHDVKFKYFHINGFRYHSLHL